MLTLVQAASSPLPKNLTNRPKTKSALFRLHTIDLFKWRRTASIKPFTSLHMLAE